ncbi:MAG TPA: Re/Si-specific NAD(P)(+) transhydrogenase subunit alpha [Gemmatimonadaceae bacterium]|nr:Re/Si-specific NAD(P)(+) transhydrogenase subunit alpha [Gemmatimonadaceae bacterium]
MRIALPKETAPRERRVALAPDSVARLVKSGHEVVVARGAGTAAGFTDEAYTAAGAQLADGFTATVANAAIVAKVRPPNDEEADALPPGATLFSLLHPARNEAVIARLKARGVRALALELVPRITRAQSMDVLSSQATVSGYKAALIGAAEMDKFLPMLTTAAGNVPPAKAFVLGAGVAGLMAIATARRLGAVVSAFDVRPAAREQVMSLGASFVASELVTATAEAAGGYARAQTEEEQARTREAVAKHAKDMDLIITTAQVPGRTAPRLLAAAAVHAMRAGSVIVDLAADGGGNVELTKAGETIVTGNGVRIIGPLDLAATVPYHASQMFGKNILALMGEIVREGQVDLDGEIARAMVVTG